ncbi:MAG: radical SAM protein [Dethiobacteria bacterium]
MSFETVKKVAAEMALDRAAHYASQNPEHNISVMLDFAMRIAPGQDQKKNIASLKEHFKAHPQIYEQVRRLASNPKMLSKLMINWVGNNELVGKSVRENHARELGVSVPSLILVDPTTACNLRCEGCWAGEYKKSESLEPELLDRIFREAKELGIYWIVLSGGEPFAYRPLLDVIADHPDMGFMAYTNGTLIDEGTADRLAELANLSPAFSLEGWREQTDARRGSGTFDKVMKAMDLLRERGVFFGASVTATRCNVDTLFSDEFIDFLVEKGAVYEWCFHYVPVGREPDTSLMLTTDQRARLARRVPELRREKPILVADFWNDGESTKGCIAGGRIYFHINASGDVEPCAFAHFAADNIRGKSLKEVLKNPLFKAFQKRQPFDDNHLVPCPIIDHPQELRDMIRESGARPTHKGADDILKEPVAGHLDHLSACWKHEADLIKDEREEKESLACLKQSASV